MAATLHLLLLASVALAQIGVDKVDEPMTAHIIEIHTAYLTQDASLFGAPIGVNTQYLTEENGVTKWIGANTEYLTQVTATTNNAQGSPAIVTQDVKATIIGDPPIDGALGADVAVIVSPAFLAEINGIKTSFCSKKRALTCGIDFVDKVAAAFDIYAAAEGAKWTAGASGIAIVGAMYAAQAKKITEEGKDIPLKMKINKDDYNKATPINTKIITITKSKSATTTSSSTSSTAVEGGGKGGATATVSPNECWKYTGSNPDTSNVEIDDGETMSDAFEGPLNKIKRLAGRVTYVESEPTTINGILQSKNPAMVMKRGDIGNLGSCTDLLPDDFRTATKYPKVGDQTRRAVPSLPQNQWWFVPRPKDDSKLCQIYTLQHVTGDKLGPNKLPPGYAQTRGSRQQVSIDHTYEVSFIQDFFSSVFTDPNDPRCKPFLDMFLQPNKYEDKEDPDANKHSRLQSLFFLGPNKKNKGFIGLDQKINSLKGNLMNPLLKGIQGIDQEKNLFATDKNLNLWNDIAMAWSVLKIPVVQEKFKQINTDVYRAFLRFDDLQCNEKFKGGGIGGSYQSWASSYQDWVTSFLRQRQAETIAYVASIKSAIEAAPMTTTEPGGQVKNMYGNALDALAAEFPEEFYALDTAALLDFSGDPLDIILKRDDMKIGIPACLNAVIRPSPPPGLPKTPEICKEKKIFGCEIRDIYRPDIQLADCPTPMVTTLPASCSAGQPTATATAASRPLFSHTCTARDGTYLPFSRSRAFEAIDEGCSPNPKGYGLTNGNNYITMPDSGYFTVAASDQETKSPLLYFLGIRWSQDQTGCNARGSNQISVEDCKNVFHSAVDECDTNTITEKYGSYPLVWSSSHGCIDVRMNAIKRPAAFGG